eukprot:scaffold77452_cov17-Tisochrysis_lutea.AAC.1
MSSHIIFSADWREGWCTGAARSVCAHPGSPGPAAAAAAVSVHGTAGRGASRSWAQTADSPRGSQGRRWGPGPCLHCHVSSSGKASAMQAGLEIGHG